MRQKGVVGDGTPEMMVHYEDGNLASGGVREFHNERCRCAESAATSMRLTACGCTLGNVRTVRRVSSVKGREVALSGLSIVPYLRGEC